MKFNSKFSILFCGYLCVTSTVTLLSSVSLFAGEESPANMSARVQGLTGTSDPDNNKGGPVDAFPGKGEIDNTGIPSPGKYEINLSFNRAFGEGRSIDSTSAIELNYGFEFYRDFQIGCVIPYVTEIEKNEEGSSYRQSGGGSPSCSAKVLFYENVKTGMTASVAVNYQRARSIMFKNFSGNSLENHIIVPVVVQKDINDGKISLLGTVIVDHTIFAGEPIDHQNQMTYGAGTGYRFNDDRSLSVDVTKTIQGVAWVDVVYMQRSKFLTHKMNRDTFAYVKVGKSSNGSYADSGQRTLEVGLQINGRSQHGIKGGIFHEIVEAKENAEAKKDNNQ